MPEESLPADVRELQEAIRTKQRQLKSLTPQARQALQYERLLLRQRQCERYAQGCRDAAERFAQNLPQAAVAVLAPVASREAAQVRLKKEVR